MPPTPRGLRQGGLVRGMGVFHEQAGAQSLKLVTLVIYVEIITVDRVKA
jgi:hypothetical protein